VRTSILHDIIARTDGLDVPSAAKEQFKRMVRHLGAEHGVGGMAHAEQIDYARRLLLARTSRATIRDRLMALFEISRSQAYNVIQAAINRPE
jgi:hypothetical protein